MKQRTNIWIGAFLVLFLVSSCDDFLNVNENPNAATSVSTDLILPQAIVSTASLTNAYNNYGLHFGGYMANAGGFSGFGNLLTYDVLPGTYDGLWTATYLNSLQDFKVIIDASEGIDKLAYFNAAAKILSALNYQRLVDTFGDVPYTEALKGNDNLAPEYDDAEAIYQDLVAKLDDAIATIDDAEFPTALNSSTDPLFGGDMDNWIRFANTIKLRLLIRVSGVASLNAFTTSAFSALDTYVTNSGIGFLEDDATVNPGYVKNFPNPLWNSWGYTTTGALSNSSRIPTRFIFGFYNGVKISDEGRGSVIFKNYPSTPVNQLGNEVGNPTVVTNYSTWYTGVFSSASSISNALGVLKGPTQGQVLMLAAEGHFLQAEAYLKGYLTGDFEASYNDGIRASFTYLYKEVNGEVSATKDVDADVAAYFAENPTNRLVDITLASGVSQQLEAIITQKYIALNFINCDEGWNEFRRTGFPVTVPLGAPELDIASTKSNSTRTDRMISRVKYPSSEQAYNSANYTDINQFADLIFWDPN
jgi:hypothetical protein